ncbi:hypothetical protein HKX48_002910 [Thoreauomyces humboldtii]|nr:hypothetical protein HKX48_002910 [Thoreauomyces humboldtii]
MTASLRRWRSADGFFPKNSHDSKDKPIRRRSLFGWLRNEDDRNARQTTVRTIVFAVALWFLAIALRRIHLNNSIRRKSTCDSESDDVPYECVDTIERLKILTEPARRTPRIWDWHNMVPRSRLFRSLLEERYTIAGHEKANCLRFIGPEHTGVPTLPQLDAVIMEIQNDLYPFVATPTSRFPSAQHLLRSYSGRGIVMTTGNRHTRFALNTIRMVRSLGCNLPIQIFYANNLDLNGTHFKELASLPNVELLDMSKHIDIHAASRGEPLAHLGWAMKPFSMLASRFQEIILLDADVMFLQNPEVMFEYPLYKDTGILLFRDRTLYPGNTLHALLSRMMEETPMSDYYRKEGRTGSALSTHEGESGVIVVDKHRNFHSLLMACKMNSGPYQRDMYETVLGDKESYWMAQEILDLPYSWAPGGGGSIGYLEPHPNDPNIIKICGQLYHPDPDFRPLWANGGMLSNKRDPKGEDIVEFTHWATDKTYRNVVWDWEKANKPFCMHRRKDREGKDWGPLSRRELDIIDRALKDWKEIVHFGDGNGKQGGKVKVDVDWVAKKMVAEEAVKRHQPKDLKDGVHGKGAFDSRDTLEQGRPIMHGA